MRVALLVALLCGAVAGCASLAGTTLPAPTAALPGAGAAAAGTLLGPGDKLRVTVYREPDLSGTFEIDGGGRVALPLIGAIDAAGATSPELERRIVAALAGGFLKAPRVAVEVLTYRAFYIVGEVKRGGEFPYKAGLTVADAVAMAGGYTYRARTGRALIRRAGSDREESHALEASVAVQPGDNIRIPERYF